MTNQTRCALESDIAALHNIWESAFGEGDSVDFFQFYFKPELCIVAEREGSPAGAGYLVPFGNLICGGLTVPCAMIYAVAVLPEFRRLGLGESVVRGLIEYGKASGYPAIVLCPSDDSLFRYYSERSVLKDWFFTTERQMTQIRPSANTARLTRISAEEYRSLRENLLAGMPHIAMDRDAFLFQDILCRHEGGGLFLAATTGGDACAVVERQPGGAVWVKELLAPAGCEQEALSSIAMEFPASSYLIRTPTSCFRPNSESTASSEARRFGMLSASPELITPSHSPALPWYGLAFD